MADEFCLKMPDSHVTFRDLLHAVNLRHGTDGFIYPPKKGVLRIFFALKNPTAAVGFEPANLGTKGQHAAGVFKQRVLGRPMGLIAKNNALQTDRLYRNLDKKLLS